MQQFTLSDQDFGNFQRFIFEAAGITLSPAKKALVCGRLAKRVHARQLDSYAAYFDLLRSRRDLKEVQAAVDLLTTNETYFFREPKHFDLLREVAAAHDGTRPFRIWSAACSSGEEAYSMAMVLGDCMAGRAFEVIGTDISTRMLARARTGHYPDTRARLIPPTYLKRFCLRGQGEHEGTMLVDRSLRARVRFSHANLNDRLPDVGMFDMVFLRNVMIYFNGATKRQVVARVLGQLRPGGHFCIGHSETLNDVSDAVEQLAPSVYRKPL
ncbi:CheR family methyltransferase [Cupriavidus plantarum]|uniref:Chemotaxis protein methyltransferase n=1 Tax=Cupriavidus plantarum TaxID=942865 RepID=A0A316EVI0_9BURK|nr:protein-glutamate O-methyltransferase CheR [Cupriavidus plantarum]PWK34923.1 chemotaxis protein methyltransferase CheR [Cupriavidus plantarum]